MYGARSGLISLCTKCIGEGMLFPEVGKVTDWKKVLLSKPFPNPLERRLFDATVANGNLIVTPCNETPGGTVKKIAKQGSTTIGVRVDAVPSGLFFARKLGAGNFPTLYGLVTRQIFNQIRTSDRIVTGFKAMLPSGLLGSLYRLEGWTGEGLHMSLTGFSLSRKGANAQETHEMRAKGMASFLEPGALSAFKNRVNTAPDFDNDGVKVWDIPHMQFSETADSVAALGTSIRDAVWRHPDFTVVAPAHKSLHITPWRIGVGQRVKSILPSYN